MVRSPAWQRSRIYALNSAGGAPWAPAPEKKPRPRRSLTPTVRPALYCHTACWSSASTPGPPGCESASSAKPSSRANRNDSTRSPRRRAIRHALRTLAGTGRVSKIVERDSDQMKEVGRRIWQHNPQGSDRRRVWEERSDPDGVLRAGPNRVRRMAKLHTVERSRVPQYGRRPGRDLQRRRKICQRRGPGPPRLSPSRALPHRRASPDRAGHDLTRRFL